jgi:hypothetical protein
LPALGYGANPLVKACFFFADIGDGDQDGVEGEPRKLARKVAEHYSARTNQTREEREASPIIYLKKLNNWVGLEPNQCTKPPSTGVEGLSAKLSFCQDFNLKACRYNLLRVAGCLL